MKRIIIKLSGESLANREKRLSIDPNILLNIVDQINQIIKQGIQVGIVIGGGNFWRGATAEKNGISRNRADYIGMLATLMNGLALQSAFQKQNIKTRIQSSLAIDPKVAENYVNEKAIKALEKNEVVIFTGGTGRPFFTTDTAATLVASEIKADTILMAKNGVDGIYNDDPKKNPQAKKYTTITYNQLIKEHLLVMDATAVAMARDNNIKLIVFDINQPQALTKAIEGKIASTIVSK